MLSPDAWLRGGDTGISSETIWAVMMNRSPGARFRPDTPADPSDFGRCHRLLQAFPWMRDRLGEVAAAYPKWKPLVDAWAELEALYVEESPSGTAPKLWARMNELSGRKWWPRTEAT